MFVLHVSLKPSNQHPSVFETIVFEILDTYIFVTHEISTQSYFEFTDVSFLRYSCKTWDTCLLFTLQTGGKVPHGRIVSLIATRICRVVSSFQINMLFSCTSSSFIFKLQHKQLHNKKLIKHNYKVGRLIWSLFRMCLLCLCVDRCLSYGYLTDIFSNKMMLKTA